MKRLVYPFAAIVGQEEMKLALLLAAVDWRISVVLRGDKGAGKTTAARAIAVLLPAPSPFINLPIGATEDRLLGGLHLERTLKGDPALKPGLLSEANGGVLYVDEINLLPAHLGDALLDTASSGVNIVEREGLSASHPAEFVLLGSMNPDEGSLRPQLLDRFALAVDVTAALDPALRQTVVERRLNFERNPTTFHADWSESEQRLREQVASAREHLPNITCSQEILTLISTSICNAGVSSLRADLAVVRAAIAYAALLGDEAVTPTHVDTVFPLVLAHRSPDRRSSPQPQPPAPKTQPNPQSETNNTPGPQGQSASQTRIYTPKEMKTPTLRAASENLAIRGIGASSQPGPIIGTRQTEAPTELDLRATLTHALLETGKLQPKTTDLHTRIRRPTAGTRFLFVIDSSGSHAAQERMRLVKGAATGLLKRSFKNGDEVAIIIFRGPSAQTLLEPTHALPEALTAFEYLPTGGRTPLTHALDLAQAYLTPATILILLTDGRANVAIGTGDPWQEALTLAAHIRTPALVVDTENSAERFGHSRKLAEALSAEYILLEDLESQHELVLSQLRLPLAARS